MFVIKHKNFLLGLTTALMLVALVITFMWTPPLSIEFTGGSVVEGEYASTSPAVELLNSNVSDLNVGTVHVQPVGEKGLLVRARDLTLDEHNQLISALSPAGNTFHEINSSTIGPSVGAELRSKAILSVILVLALIIIFVAFAFRSASRSVSSWKFGLAVIICLIHDIFVPVGIFAILAHVLPGFEIDTLFVTAILAILGYSVADTIVVFDRIRENLKSGLPKQGNDISYSPFEMVVGRSLAETYSRSINTSLTVILAALAIFFFGGEATRHFALMLAIGIAAGTYSSILFASPLLVKLAGRSVKKA